MFEKLNQKDIYEAASVLVKQTELRSTRYRVWFHGKKIPPKDLIRKAYELANKKNPNPNFNTDQAQVRLLDLGFPIIDTERDDNFFSEKELASFSRFIQRKSYNSKNEIDQNIGAFLNKVIWEKTRYWALGLKELGWKVEGTKQWNTQDRTTGQNYKQYTWYRIFPEEYDEKLFFTVGVNWQGALHYKLDIKRSDPFFNEKKKHFFDELRERMSLNPQPISKHVLDTYSWEQLINESHDFFIQNIENYKKVKDKLWSNIRLMRLTWNKNNWELPTVHKWKKENQGKTNIAFEHQYGFGYEEWLFNSRYRIGDYQYGYLRGVDQLSKDNVFLEKIFLYTISDSDKTRSLVGEIDEAEVIKPFEEESEEVKEVIQKYHSEALSELESVSADISYYKRHGLRPNVRFKWRNLELYNEPILSTYLNSSKFSRYQPYKIEGGVDVEVLNVSNQKKAFSFEAGKASTTSEYEKTTEGGTRKVRRTHSLITDDLYDYFHQVKGKQLDCLSSEKTRVGGAEVDFVLKDKNTFTLFEVKTSSKGLMNIRLAIGQLFEYAFLDRDINIKKLVIVGPAHLNETEIDYLERIQTVISTELEYWVYQSSEKNLEDKFFIQA